MSDAAPRTPLLIPPLGALYRALEPVAYSALRLVAGAFLMPHGYPKLFGTPGLAGAAKAMAAHGLEPALLFAGLIGAVEFFGGLLMAVGLFTRVAATAIAIEMAYIGFFVLWDKGFFWLKGGFEYALMWCAVALLVALRGGGRYSLDRLVGREI